MSTKSAVTTLELIGGTCTVLCTTTLIAAIALGAENEATGCITATALTVLFGAIYKFCEVKSTTLSRKLTPADRAKAGL